MTTEEAIKNNADSLKRFLKATVRGVKYAFGGKHFEESAGYVVEANPVVEMDAAVGAGQVAAMLSFTKEVTTGKVAVGQFEPERVKKSRDITEKFLGLKKTVAVKDLYTNDLLPETK